MQHQDYEKLMKILSLLGGIIAIIEGFLGVITTQFGDLNYSFVLVAGIASIGIGIIIIFSTLKPNEPIPFDWIVLLILGILLVIFTAYIGGILTTVAAVIGLLEEYL